MHVTALESFVDLVMSMVCSVVDNSDSLSGVLLVSVSQKVGFLPAELI